MCVQFAIVVLANLFESESCWFTILITVRYIIVMLLSDYYVLLVISYLVCVVRTKALFIDTVAVTIM